MKVIKIPFRQNVDEKYSIKIKEKMTDQGIQQKAYMTSPNSQPIPTNPTEILAAQLKLQENAYRLALQTRTDVNQKLDLIIKAQTEQNARIDGLKSSGNSFPASLKFIAIDAVISAVVGGLWAGAYLINTEIVDSHILLWKYVAGEEYGLGLVSSEMLFVVVSRFIIGFSLTFGFVALWVLIIDGLTKISKSIFGKSG